MECLVIRVVTMFEIPIFSLFSLYSNFKRSHYLRIIWLEANIRFEQPQTENGDVKPNMEYSKLG